jgi:hypothetical protein
VVGNAGIVRPLDQAAWAGVLDEAVSRRHELVAAGVERVKQYSTRLSAEDLVRAYRLALG